jgi:hypothetical protein
MACSPTLFPLFSLLFSFQPVAACAHRCRWRALYVIYVTDDLAENRPKTG